MKPLVTFTSLVGIATFSVSNAAVLYSLDIDDDVSSGTQVTQSGFTSLIGQEGTTATLSPVTFTLFGGVAGTRDRGAVGTNPDSDMLRDFSFKDASGGATALRIEGLAAGVYDIESWHYDDDFSSTTDTIDVEIRPVGGSTTVLVSGHTFSTTAATYQITADGTTNYELIFRETNVNNRSRFNGIRISSVPEPSSALLLGLGTLALVCRRRK